MIRYTAGFTPTNDGTTAKPVKQNPSLPSVVTAKALAAARQTQVLGHTQQKPVQSPLKQNLRTDGPTLEKWLEAGYKAENYPPEGYAELDSPALTEYKAKVAAASTPTANGEPPAPHSINTKPEVPK